MGVVRADVDWFSVEFVMSFERYFEFIESGLCFVFRHALKWCSVLSEVSFVFDDTVQRGGPCRGVRVFSRFDVADGSSVFFNVKGGCLEPTPWVNGVPENTVLNQMVVELPLSVMDAYGVFVGDPDMHRFYARHISSDERIDNVKLLRICFSGGVFDVDVKRFSNCFFDIFASVNARDVRFVSNRGHEYAKDCLKWLSCRYAGNERTEYWDLWWTAFDLFMLLDTVASPLRRMMMREIVLCLSTVMEQCWYSTQDKSESNRSHGYSLGGSIWEHDHNEKICHGDIDSQIWLSSLYLTRNRMIHGGHFDIQLFDVSRGVSGNKEHPVIVEMSSHVMFNYLMYSRVGVQWMENNPKRL